MEFDNPVYINAIHIYETYNSGAVYRISALNKPSSWIDIWTGTPTRISSSRIFKPQVQSTSFATNVIKLYLNCTISQSWAEIDAVKLIGEPGKPFL